MTAKELLLQEVPHWTEHDAKVALRAVEEEAAAGQPERERLSNVLRETEGRVFRDEEFAAHLERVAASQDDLPAGPFA
jgi:ABC-type ATPase with predicted acetyltransferase domain